MKTPVILIITLSALWLPVHADDNVSPDVAAIGMLPKQRTAQRLAANERNPFAFKPKEPAKAAVEETETQESKIRALFKLMAVSGVRRGADGRLMALVGDLILREGEEVRQVLPEQTELLMVSRIEPKKVELTFVENKDSTQPRTIVLPIAGQTRVAQKLAGQGKGGKTMYFPLLRAAAAGVAAVLSSTGGSGGVPASQTLADTSEPAAGAELSGVGTITAPPPARSAAERPERMSFAALAPPGSSPGSRGSVLLFPLRRRWTARGRRNRLRRPSRSPKVAPRRAPARFRRRLLRPCQRPPRRPRHKRRRRFRHPQSLSRKRRPRRPSRSQAARRHPRRPRPPS